MIEGLVVVGILAVAYVLIKRAKAKRDGGTGTPTTGGGGGTRPGGGTIDQREIQ